jgi:hypothetical protein
MSKPKHKIATKKQFEATLLITTRSAQRRLMHAYNHAHAMREAEALYAMPFQGDRFGCGISISVDSIKRVAKRVANPCTHQ